MFKKPFEEVANSKVLLALETVSSLENTSDYHVYPLTQRELLSEGWDYPEDYEEAKEEEFKCGKYEGSKWGGRYLRAPDVFFDILQKGRGKLVRLKRIARVRFGCHSGINDFFYLTDARVKEFGIPARYLQPLLRSPQLVESAIISDHSGYYVLSCGDKPGLLANGAKKYVEWGARQKTRGRQQVKAGIPWPKVESVKRRKPAWYALPQKDLIQSQSFVLYVWNDTAKMPFSRNPIVSDACFHRVLQFKEDPLLVSSLLKSTVTCLHAQLLGRSNLGQGAMKLERLDTEKLLVPDPSLLSKEIRQELINGFSGMGKRRLKSIFEECGIDPARPIREQEPKPPRDREKLDGVVFDFIGLTQSERKEVYWSVCELVKARLDKAKSLKKRR